MKPTTNNKTKTQGDLFFKNSCMIFQSVQNLHNFDTLDWFWYFSITIYFYFSALRADLIQWRITWKLDWWRPPQWLDLLMPTPGPSLGRTNPEGPSTATRTVAWLPSNSLVAWESTKTMAMNLRTGISIKILFTKWWSGNINYRKSSCCTGIYENYVNQSI